MLQYLIQMTVLVLALSESVNIPSTRVKESHEAENVSERPSDFLRVEFKNSKMQDWDAFGGTWQLVGEVSAAEKLIKTAIDQATEKMNFLTRGIARDRLAGTLKAPKRIRMQRQAQTFIIHPDTSIAFSMPLSGEPVKYDERRLRVSLKSEDGSLVLSHFSEDPRGKRDGIYRLQNDGKSMALEVTVSSSQIPAPVRYKLQFNRVE